MLTWQLPILAKTSLSYGKLVLQKKQGNARVKTKEKEAGDVQGGRAAG